MKDNVGGLWFELCQTQQEQLEGGGAEKIHGWGGAVVEGTYQMKYSGTLS